MFCIKTTKSFRRSFKRYRRSGKFPETDLERAVHMIASRTPLPVKYQDHALQGLMRDFRECHVLPDLLLIYRIFDEKLVLVLVGLGSHAELFER